MHQGGGPRPPRGMPPPTIILDMQAMERSRERNLREARERVRKRLQEEARQAARRLEAHQQRQSVHDRHQPTVGVEVLREQPIRNSQCSKPNCYLSRFEVPQDEQSRNKKTRRGFVPETCDGEGIYEQLDETLMNVN